MLIIASNRLIEIDVDDLDDVSGFQWRLDGNGYVVRTVRKVKIELLHRMILRVPSGKVVDHIDGDPSNNSRRNLRICTFAENLRNRRKSKANKCGLKGVYRSRKKWRAQIKIDARKINLGMHETPELAHAAYCAAAVQHHGEFARFS